MKMEAMSPGGPFSALKKSVCAVDQLPATYTTHTLSCLSGVICTLIPNCLTALVVRHSTMAINLCAVGIMVPALGRSP